MIYVIFEYFGEVKNYFKELILSGYGKPTISTTTNKNLAKKIKVSDVDDLIENLKQATGFKMTKEPFYTFSDYIKEL